MKVICELSGIIDYRRPVQGITDIKNAGFEQVAVSLNYLYKNETEFSADHQSFSEDYKSFIGKSRRENIHISVFRVPRIIYDIHQAVLFKIRQKAAVEAIKLCGEAGGQYVIVPPAFEGASGIKAWQMNRDYYLNLAKSACENNVMILIENQYKNYNGHMVRGIWSDAGEAAEWLDKLNELMGEERFGFCMNTGTCSLCGQDMHDFAASLGSRIKVVVLRDCDGHNEASMLPFTAVSRGQTQTDWLSLIRGLREICFDGGLILDIRDTVAAFSPLLRPQLLSFAKATVEYIRWQIEIEHSLKKYKSIVLFGAGNMCRNYMKCYGEKYPPLFTCDNNKELWGTNFCGLEVKPPEALRKIPSDCGIFICNIYYREIEKQLRDMGIENNIEFFNDEYMPSFHFDRLKRM